MIFLWCKLIFVSAAWNPETIDYAFKTVILFFFLLQVTNAALLAIWNYVKKIEYN